MPFMAIDGKYIPVFADSVTEDFIDVGDAVSRGLIGSPLRTRTRQLRRWTFTTRVMPYVEAQKYTKWIEGFGLRIPVLRGGAVSQYASTGISDASAGSQSFLSSTGANSGLSAVMTIASGSSWGFNPRFRMGSNRVQLSATSGSGYNAGRDGCSIIGWREWTSTPVDEGVGATGFKHTIASLAAGSSTFARSDGTPDPTGLGQFINGASSTPANMGRILGMEGSLIALYGMRNDAGTTNEAVKWSDTIVVPFAIDDTKESCAPAGWSTGWVSQLYEYAQNYEMGDLPYRWLTGDVVGGDRVCVLGRVLRHRQQNVKFAGTLHTNARELEIELLESPRYTPTPSTSL